MLPVAFTRANIPHHANLHNGGGGARRLIIPLRTVSRWLRKESGKDSEYSWAHAVMATSRTLGFVYFSRSIIWPCVKLKKARALLNLKSDTNTIYQKLLVVIIYIELANI